MITVNLYGRTGNNMFQIAAAISAAKRINTRPYYFGDESCLKGFKINGISKIPKMCEKSFNEKMFSYDKSFEHIIDNTNLDGYFQSEKYFKNSEEEVRKCFSFDLNTLQMVKKIKKGKYNNIIKENFTTALHVRRTDYLKYEDVYNQCGLDYYHKCLSNIKNPGNILVFSDDIEWCKNNFHGQEYEFIEAPPIPSMYLMSKCKNIVMANSSFSWWASWLGEPENVFYPKLWFGNKWPHKEVHPTQEDCIKDLCPDRWIKI